MKSVVVVSHSAKFAEGTAELIKMAASDLSLAYAGGTEDGSLGTSYEKIKKAIESVYSDDGVVVIPDMGSSVMTTEMVIEELAAEGKANVEIAPLHLAEDFMSFCLNLGKEEDKKEDLCESDLADFECTVKDPVGLHARPAAEIVKFCQKLDAKVFAEYENKKASCTSLIELLSLGATCGAELKFSVIGTNASQTMVLLKEFIKENI